MTATPTDGIAPTPAHERLRVELVRVYDPEKRPIDRSLSLSIIGGDLIYEGSRPAGLVVGPPKSGVLLVMSGSGIATVALVAQSRTLMIYRYVSPLGWNECMVAAASAGLAQVGEVVDQ